jgi:hypothetical protein
MGFFVPQARQLFSRGLENFSDVPIETGINNPILALSTAEC